LWTRKVDNKTVTRRLSSAELTDYQQFFDNAKRLRGLVAELQELTLSLVDGPSESVETPVSSKAPKRRTQ
jgi:hypothetical protein